MRYNFYMNQGFIGEKPETVLKAVFGYDEFRPLQKEIIENVLSGRDTLAIMPTGGGKSLCYQIPALIFEGLTVVVSPLIALMTDQVSQLLAAGVDAVFLNSSLDWADYTDAMDRIREGRTRIVYVSPEGLSTSRIRDLLSSVKVSCITIDEAHCVSEWGHDFRPDYLEIAGVRRIFSDAVCLALTATATKKVQSDIIKNLALKNPEVLISSFDRPNIFLEVRPKRDAISQVCECIKRHWGESGIIYCFSKKGVDELAQTLIDLGYSASNYHAGLSPDEREDHQKKFLNDEIQIMVATVAFGMGINKPNVRFVIHYDLPKSVEQYYQEIGRAGRDGLPSTALLLYSPGDIRKIKFLLQDAQDQEGALRLLQGIIDYAQARRCRRKVILSYFGEKPSENQNPCCCDICDFDLASGGSTGSPTSATDVTVPTQKLLSCIIRTNMRFGASYVISVLLGSREKRILENGHDELSTWGIGKELSKDDWFELVAALIESGYLIKTEDYSVLKLTEKGASSLRNREEIRLSVRFTGASGTNELGLLKPKPQKKQKSAVLHKKPISVLDEEDTIGNNIAIELRKWRKKRADEDNVPPYVIFGDKTLFDIAAKKPKTTDELYEVNGLGDRKIERYGEAILGIVAGEG